MNTKLNIGITIYLKSENESVFINGIKQNAIFLAKLFMNSTHNYNVYIVNMSDVKITNQLEWDIDKYKTINYGEIKDKLDIIFPLGGSLNKQETEYLRNRGCKVVPYKCGNEYIISMENAIFNRNDSPMDYPEVDQVWCIPQMENTNSQYFSMLHRAETITIPFVWDSMFLDLYIEDLKKEGKNPYYKPSKSPKRISVLEPNINVYKYAVYPILITEKLYRKNKNLIKNLKVTNTQNIRNNKEFISIMRHLDIVNDGKATFENRYSTPWFLSEHTDVVVSHQWENPLNYAYLDTIYMGYPLVHNAHLCKECGYYYNGFDINDGFEQLEYAIVHHDDNIEQYNYNTDKILYQYSSTNINSIKTYDELIYNLMKK